LLLNSSNRKGYRSDRNSDQKAGETGKGGGQGREKNLGVSTQDRKKIRVRVFFLVAENKFQNLGNLKFETENFGRSNEIRDSKKLKFKTKMI
jgi:hypothetical protein